MKNIEILNKIISSKNVSKKFYQTLSQNKDFELWLLNILPEIRDCINQKQRTPWHLYNVMNHILKSIEEINNLTKNYSSIEKLMLAYVMFFHDIGKPKSHIVYTKNEKEFDSFPHHNVISQQIFDRFSNNLSFDERTKKIMSQLIFYHDVFINFTNDISFEPNKELINENLIDKYIIKFNKYGNGKEIFNYLLCVGIADNKAQNLELTKDKIKQIKTIKIIMENVAVNNNIKNN